MPPAASEYRSSTVTLLALWDCGTNSDCTCDIVNIHVYNLSSGREYLLLQRRKIAAESDDLFLMSAEVHERIYAP